MSELDRLKEQLVYLRFWLGIMAVAEITLVGWLISTPNTADPVLWSLAAVGVVLASVSSFYIARSSAALKRSGGYSHGNSRWRHHACCGAAFRRYCT